MGKRKDLQNSPVKEPFFRQNIRIGVFVYRERVLHDL